MLLSVLPIARVNAKAGAARIFARGTLLRHPCIMRLGLGARPLRAGGTTQMRCDKGQFEPKGYCAVLTATEGSLGAAAQSNLIDVSTGKLKIRADASAVCRFVREFFFPHTAPFR